jgi:acyl-CoA synthetase (AMP-forming)/AMP-acid ligase II
MAPTLLQRLVDAQRERPRDVSSLRALILGAAPCPYELKVRADAVFGKVLWEFYGATETGINTVLRPEDQLRKPGSCGTAVPGQEIRLMGPDGAEAAVGEPGEFMVRNSWLAEYYNRPDATGKSLHDGFFSVGDIAYRDAEGYYYICDRRIDMIISGGVNIYPAEVEAVLHAHPAVMDAAVIGVPDEKWGESVKAIVQLRAGATANEDGWSRSAMSAWRVTRSLARSTSWTSSHRDAAGKLLKRRIREPYWPRRVDASDRIGLVRPRRRLLRPHPGAPGFVDGPSDTHALSRDTERRPLPRDRRRNRTHRTAAGAGGSTGRGRRHLTRDVAQAGRKDG